MSEEKVDKYNKITLLSKRSCGRVMTIQAVYNYYLRQRTNYPLEMGEIIKFFLNSNPKDLMFSGSKAPVLADKEFFQRNLDLTMQNMEVIDQYISNQLKDDKNIGELDSVLISILRCGVGELLYNESVPKKVTVNEYVTITKYFFSDKIISLVNAILDNISKIIETKN